MRTTTDKAPPPASDERGQLSDPCAEQHRLGIHHASGEDLAKDTKMNLVLAWLSLAVVAPAVVGGIIFSCMKTDTKRQPSSNVPAPASSSPSPEAAKAHQEFERIDRERQQRETADRPDWVDRSLRR